MKLNIVPGGLNCFYFSLQNMWIIIDLTRYGQSQPSPSVQFLTNDYFKKNILKQFSNEPEAAKILDFIDGKQNLTHIESKTSFCCTGTSEDSPHHPEKIFISIMYTLNTLSLKFQNKRLNKHYPISKREKEILQYISLGLSSKQIADELCIGQTTVITHRKNLLTKFDAKNTAELVRKALQHKEIVI